MFLFHLKNSAHKGVNTPGLPSKVLHQTLAIYANVKSETTIIGCSTFISPGLNELIYARNVCVPRCESSLSTYIDEVEVWMQERRNSIANALELRLSCTNPMIYNMALICNWFRIQGQIRHLLLKVKVKVVLPEGEMKWSVLGHSSTPINTPKLSNAYKVKCRCNSV